MFGRLGSVYVVHLAEAKAQQHRLSQPDRPVDANLGVFLRLLGVIGLGLCATGFVAMMVA
ncbi:hypothetical protein J2T08_000768 [Neorhizobium galegae]|uniref:hypothetical protein n=1 Tax=Neorhizobium galegae TaxID=399 RepID=UPI0027887C37|nr:hypothetical protein [Neorhizobium galegae]MDQ0132867.1 hypothetical protein [Neorhizobium galegae]